LRQLDAETTKLLGGDLDNTHYVRGLDYALLQKIKSSSSSGKDKEKNETADDERKLSTADIITFTPLGSRLKSLIFTDNVVGSVFSKSQTVSKSQVSRKQKHVVGNDFSRITFLFEIEPESEADLPVTHTRSRKVFDYLYNKVHQRMNSKIYTFNFICQF